MNNNLKPALILGSGFHRHVFGAENNLNHYHSIYQPLWDWHALIDATAERMQVACSSRAQEPVMRWETLIIRAQKDGFRDLKGEWIPPSEHAAHEVEDKAKVFVADILKELSTNYPESRRSQIPLSRDWGCVISLNFDHAWLGGLKPSNMEVTVPGGVSNANKVSDTERYRTEASVPPEVIGQSGNSNPRVWFPNGTILKPKSIRMGLHDYGGSTTSIKETFGQLKAWERQTPPAGTARTKTNFEHVVGALRNASEKEQTIAPSLDKPDIPDMPLTWVAEFMYRPLWFAGVGLSSQESGLWWLLAQRARNTARVQGLPEDHTRILVHKKDRSKFWASRPFGVKAVFCDNWDDGWDHILKSLN